MKSRRVEEERPVGQEIRILMLEDEATDAELVERQLRRGRVDCSTSRVETREAFIAGLRRRPDLILADYSLPAFDGMAALALAQQQCPDVPFVFVSGAIGEELAIESLKQGATDYVLKDRLSRLAPAVRRSLEEAAQRSARVAAEDALRRSEAKHRALLEINNAIISNLDRESLFQAIAQGVGRIIVSDRSCLTLLDRDRELVTVTGLAGIEASEEHFPVGTEFPSRGSHLEPVLTAGETLVRRSLESAQAVGEESRLLKIGIRSYVSVPLVTKGAVIGSLNVGSLAADSYSESDVEFLAEVGQQISLAVGNMLAYEEIAQLKARLEQENIYLQEEIKTGHDFEEIVGETPAMMRVFSAVETVAPTEANVLLSGETGTGKELFARAVHNLSGRKDKPLVKVNCAAIPTGLVESEFFGHEKGSFTGAVSRKLGRFELADRGTVFLDEIGELPLDLQAKLLRVLQEGEFERVGGSKTFKVDVRVIAATNRDLEKEMTEERFRADLYYRLNVFPIELPPLRKRRDDTPLLVRHFVKKHGAKLGKKIETVPRKVMDALLAYPWPGNVRELENVIERGLILSPGPALELGEWLPKPTEAPGKARLPTLDMLQREHILKVLEFVGWKVSGEQGAAKLLGLKPTTLAARMKKLGITRPRVSS